MWNEIKEKWDKLTPEKQRTMVVVLVVGLVIVVGSLGYNVSKSSRPAKAVEEKKKDISLEPKLLEKSLYRETQKELGKRDRKIADLEKQIEEIKKIKARIDADSKVKDTMKTSLKTNVPPLPELPKRISKYPPPPKIGESSAPEVIGGIEIVAGPPVTELESKKENKKKERGIVYLPPSFMEATLLSGLDAKTVKSAKANPELVLLRIRNLAVLPNRVKANLKGCFVIAEGYGSLADERASLRLVSLSCLAKNGQAIIDQKIKGFVVDEDGKIGLRGNVVSKMGSTVARSVLAGFFGGVGDSIQAASTTTSVSAFGATQTIEAGDVVTAGIGSGIAQGAKELQRFYLDLARQAMPVIEVGATKSVTLVISEGVELEIKDYCIGGSTKCKG